MIGIAKAPVFPDPVFDFPIMSLPDKIIGIDFICISLGVIIFSSAKALTIFFSIPSFVNVSFTISILK